MNHRGHARQLKLTLPSAAMLFLAAIFAFGQLPFSSSSGWTETVDTELALARQTIHKRTVVATAAKTNRPPHLKVSMDDAVGILPSASMLAQLSAAGESTADPGPCVPVGLVHAYDACAPPTV